MRRNGLQPVSVFLGQAVLVVKKERKDRRYKRETGSEGKTPKRRSEADIVKHVYELAGPLCEVEGMELVFVEYQREASGRILRIYIDRTGGVNLDDCALVSRQMGDLVDIYLDEIDPYSLEVSSPGSDRPLGKELDFERFKGCEAKIRTVHSLEERRNFRGILLGVLRGNVNIRVEDKTVRIPFNEIQKARLINYNGEHPCLSQT